MARGPSSAGSPRLGEPAILLATWFAVGRLPWAPGTWGSLAALPLAWGIVATLGRPALAAAAVIVFLLGVWAAGVYERRSGAADPAAVVIDEVAGQWLVLLAVPAEALWYALGFALFRLFDILKPWPVSLAERRFRGGFGVMIDDVVAAGYAALVLWCVRWLGEGARW